MERAIRLMQDVKYLIFSGCYSGEVLERELTLRRQLAIGSGIAPGVIQEISGITSTKDELEKLGLVLEKLGARSVLLVSDQYHMPRLVRWARLLLPGVDIFHVSVRSSCYEFAWEPSKLKVIRSGIKPLWIAWNLAFYLATPLLLHFKTESPSSAHYP